MKGFVIKNAKTGEYVGWNEGDYYESILDAQIYSSVEEAAENIAHGVRYGFNGESIDPEIVVPVEIKEITETTETSVRQCFPR